MDNNKNKSEENEYFLPYEKYLLQILDEQKKQQSLCKIIIVLLLALIVIKLFVTG